MWWNERFTSWMCRRQIYRNCVMLSYQYGPKSLSNVSNTLLNLCHEELRQFWRQKGVQPGTSKVYLIKWPVSVYIYFTNDEAFNKTIWSETRKCLGLLITLHDTFELVNSSCDLQTHQTWWKWCKDTKDNIMLCICFMCHQSASLPCSNTTDKKYYDSPKTKPLFIQTYFSQHTLLLQSKCETHMTRWCAVSQYLLDMIGHGLWYKCCICG